MSTKVKTATKKVAKKTNKAEVAVNGTALKKAIADRTKPADKPKAEVKTDEIYHIWDVYGVKYLMDENMVPTRRVKCIEVNSDHDTSNEPELRNQLITDAEEALIKEGFAMTDVDAMEDALLNAERVIDEIRHDIEYKGMCKPCTIRELGDFTKFMKYLRDWRDRRFALAEKLGCTCNLPPVIPNDIENWHIENDQLVPNVKKPKVIKKVQITAPSADIALEGLPKNIAEPVKKALESILPTLPPELKEKALKSLPPATKSLPPAKK